MVSHLTFCMKLRRIGLKGGRARGGRLRTKPNLNLVSVTDTKRNHFGDLWMPNNLNMVRGVKGKLRREAKESDPEVVVLDGSEDEWEEKSKIKSKNIKKEIQKDQPKITNYFSPARRALASSSEKRGDHLTNGDFSDQHKSPSKENEELFNGFGFSNSVQSTICTRSQSHKLDWKVASNNLKTPEKVPKKENLVVNGYPSELNKTPPMSPLKQSLRGSTLAQSPSTSPLTSPTTPHKIQALNEEKLRLDSPLSPASAFSKLKIGLLSPNLKFSRSTSKAKRKLPNQNSALDNKGDTKVANGKSVKMMSVNGALKGDSGSNLRNTQMTEFFPIRRSHRKPKTTLIQEKQKHIEERIRSGIEEGLKVQSFDGKGRGVLTTRLFKKGEMVVEYIGDLIDMKEAKDREKKYALDTSKGCYMYYFTFQNLQYCIDATEETNYIGRLVNHSRSDANLATKTVEVNGRPHLVLIAKKDIEMGSEVLYDYGDRSKQALDHHPWLAL